MWPAAHGSLRSVFVTAHTEAAASALGEIADALVSLGLDAHEVVSASGPAPSGPDDGGTPSTGSLSIDGRVVEVAVVVRSHPTPADLQSLAVPVAEPTAAIVIADRISDVGRETLRRAGWGWLDRRGHLRLWAPGTRVESPVASLGPGRAVSGNVWTAVGLEIALAAMCHPDEPVTARRVAAVIGRSVGATHELIARFVERGLIGQRTHLPLMPELFWETAGRWPDDGWMPLPVELSVVAGRVAAADLIRVDERAATLGGARIPAVGSLPARCYVTDATAIRRLRSLVDRDRPTRTWVRRSPVRWLPRFDGAPPDDEHPWSVAHPLVCALRLAADPSRGREVVEAWGIVAGLRGGAA